MRLKGILLFTCLLDLIGLPGQLIQLTSAEAAGAPNSIQYRANYALTPRGSKTSYWQRQRLTPGAYRGVHRVGSGKLSPRRGIYDVQKLGPRPYRK